MPLGKAPRKRGYQVSAYGREGSEDIKDFQRYCWRTPKQWVEILSVSSFSGHRGWRAGESIEVLPPPPKASSCSEVAKSVL